MKKSILLAIIFFAILNQAPAQCLPQGSFNISVGYGYNAFVKTYIKSFEDEVGFKYSALGPIHAKAEYMLGNRVGLGLSLNYLSYKLSYTQYNASLTYTESAQFSTLSALARFNFYYVNTDKLAVYTGTGVGYKTYKWVFKNDGNVETVTREDLLVIPPVGFELTTGIKYMFIPNVGVYAEVGIAKSIIQAGMTFSFGGNGEGGGGGRSRGGFNRF